MIRLQIENPIDCRRDVELVVTNASLVEGFDQCSAIFDACKKEVDELKEALQKFLFSKETKVHSRMYFNQHYRNIALSFEIKGNVVQDAYFVC